MYRLCSNTQCSHPETRLKVGSQICPHCHHETDLEFEPGDTLKIDPTREARVLNKLSHSKDAGMSAVYLVERKRSSGVNVRGVLKVAKAKSVHALEREVTYLQRLQHYNIIRLLYDGDGRNPHTAIWSDTKDGQNLQFVALECMPGGSLKQKLQQQGAFDLPEALNVVKAIGQALDHLHLNNTVHLDIKPANILFGTDDRIVLSDFGVARTRQETADLAKRNVRVGTPAYNAPELLSFSTAADHRADIYALGLVLYEMLIGCNPVQFSTTSAGLSTQAHRIQQALEALPKPRELSRKIAPAVEAVILKATHPDLHQRYNSGAEMIEALEQTAAMVQRQKSVKLALAGAGVLLVLLVAMVGATAALSGHAKSDSPADGASQTLAEARPTVSSNGGGVSLGEMAVATPLPTAAVSAPLPTQPSVESNSRPAETPQATSTLAAYTSPTPVQTPTPAPVVSGRTTSPTAAAPEPTAITGSKQLIFPKNMQVFSAGTQRIEFQWRLGNDCVLPPNVGFELRIWKDGAAPMGAMDAVKQQDEINCHAGIYSFTVGDLASASGVSNASGRFNWDVLLVNTAPYHPLPGDEEPVNVFELGVPGGSSD